MENSKYLVVGSGFSGAVISRILAESGNHVVCIDKRNHIAGNCYTERHQTGIMMHKYGPHIFNTNDEKVWKFVQMFGEWKQFKNKVIADTENGMFSMPMNLLTINQFFKQKLNPSNIEDFLKQKQQNISNPQNFEEQALAFLGEELYHNFFYGYTKKQWGCFPKELPASILKRIPIRFNYDDNYYNSKFQAIPKNGYTEIVQNILDHKNIEVKLNCDYDQSQNLNFKHVFYTGAIDSYYDYKFGHLGYRTVFFEENVYDGNYQGNAVINYCDEKIPYTRIHEHKHFAPWESHEKTVVLKEFSKETGKKDEPFYPKRLEEDIEMLDKYKDLVYTLQENVSFVGRLATYRYLDMDKVIKEAIDYANYFLEVESTSKDLKISKFSDEIN